MIKVSKLIELFVSVLSINAGYIWGTSGVAWTKKRQEQINNTTDAKYEQARKYGAKWIGHVVYDCSGLFVWAFKQLGGSIYHGSNTIYKKYCSSKGQLSKGNRTDGKTLLPGSAVFTGTENDHGHIGLYIGNGEVVEAASTVKGVCKSSVTDKKWTYWGELKDVDYSGGESPSLPPDAPNDPEFVEIRKGDRGDRVKELQSLLIMKGYSCGSTGADGIFGNNTEKAVKAFQTDSGRAANGIVDAATWAALIAEDPLYTVTIPHLSKIHAEALVKNYDGATMTKEGG